MSKVTAVAASATAIAFASWLPILPVQAVPADLYISPTTRTLCNTHRTARVVRPGQLITYSWPNNNGSNYSIRRDILSQPVAGRYGLGATRAVVVQSYAMFEQNWHRGGPQCPDLFAFYKKVGTTFRVTSVSDNYALFDRWDRGMTPGGWTVIRAIPSGSAVAVTVQYSGGPLMNYRISAKLWNSNRGIIVTNVRFL